MGWRRLFTRFIMMGILFWGSFSNAAFEQFSVTGPQGTREFYLFSPSNQPRGLIVMLHGCKTEVLEFDYGTGMSQIAQAQNYAVLYPAQSRLANYDNCWNWFWGMETEIIAQGIRQIQSRFHLDRSKTFLMGMSAGAAQGAIFANCYRDMISGVLLHSGLQYLAATNLTQANDSLQKGSFTSADEASNQALRCTHSAQDIRFLIVHGTADQRVYPINAQQNVDELVMLNQKIARMNHNPGAITLSQSKIPNRVPLLGYSITHYFIDGHAQGTFLEVNGLAHEWSGGSSAQPRNNPHGPNVISLFFETIVNPKALGVKH